MSQIFKRLINLARTEFNHLVDPERKVSEEFSEFFRQRSDYQTYEDFARKTDDFSELQGYNPYKTLEVSPEASLEEIDKAYRKIARKYHPDRFQTEADRQNATKVMSIINASYEFLKKKHGKK